MCCGWATRVQVLLVSSQVCKCFILLHFVSTTYISHRCAHSILKVCYGEGDLEPFQGGVNLTAEGWENDKVISLREAAILSNPLNEFQSSMCNCKSDCATGKLHVAYSMQVQFYLLQLLATIGRCICRKNGGQCSSKCHGGRNCSNQPEEDIATEENLPEPVKQATAARQVVPLK